MEGSAVLAPEPAKVQAGYRGLLQLARALGIDLPAYQRTILRAAVDGAERETVAIIPRGNGKSTIASLLAVHHLATTPNASVALGAATREQASIVFSYMRALAEHPALSGLLLARTHEMRAEHTGGVLRVLSGRGERAHGRTDTLTIGDEVWAWPTGDPVTGGLLEAFQSGLVKNPAARFVGISTAAPRLDTPLGRLRSRAMTGEVERRGAHIDARAPGLRWLEWSLPEEAELDDYAAIARANPAPWITRQLIAEQASRLTPAAFAQLHAGRWGISEATWLPPGAWSACRDEYEVEAGEEVVVGVDVGGQRAETAVVSVTRDLRVASVATYLGDRAVLEATEEVRRLAGLYRVAEVAYDPWRFQGEAVRLEDEGLTMVQFPQSGARMVPASEGLHAAVTERRLRHPGDPDLDRHVSNAISKQTGRGWRIEQASRDLNVDGVVALAMACERAQVRVQPARFLGFI